jgi:putative DNA primase/helicase
MKTPAISQVVKFLNSLEQQSTRTFKQARAEYERSNEIQLMDAENARRLAKEMMKKGAREEAERKLSEIPELGPGPTRTRYIVNDTTVEKLGEILSENPNGVILVRDELVGFLKGLDKPGNDTQRAFMLEAWNGEGRFVYDRITRETVEIDAACVSIFGGIQPGPFSSYLKDALVSGSGDDGLMQRFQLVVWPDVPLEWRNVDRWPNMAAKEQMRRAFHFLSTVDSSLGERDEFDPDGIPFLRFEDDAQALFDSWREELEPTLRRGAEHAAIESHLSKYRSLIPSLALICHLVDAGSGPVSRDALTRALKWGRYLETHARRIYSVGMCADSSAAHELIKLIRRGALSSPFRIRDVYRNGHRGLDTSALVQTAVEMLESYGALRGVSVTDTGGRPVVEYHIHPELLGGKQ